MAFTSGPSATAPPVDLAALPADLAKLVVALPVDPVLTRFVEDREGHGELRETARKLMRRVLSDFDVNGLLGVHPMALLGPGSWEALVGRGGRLLDVGAGSGDVTEHARSLFDEIVVTETSKAMRRRLARRGFIVFGGDLALHGLAQGEPAEGEPAEGHSAEGDSAGVELGGASADELGLFDVVALLNVLDRTDRPRTLLDAAAKRLADGGRMVVSVPLPVDPHVDLGHATRDPSEAVGGRGPDFEAALVDLCRWIEGAGWVLSKISRAPYLSRGVGGCLHVLDAALLVARSRGAT